jgi:16S rRNA (guanine966-N2)-methyltransferase
MPLNVIGGMAGGVPLKSPPRGVRPTAAIVRRSLFDSLGELVVGAHALDLYAGAGSLGLEALSRGARSCDFVERDRACAAVVRANLAAINRSGPFLGRVHCAPVEKWLERHRARLSRYGLVLADPPYGESSLEVALVILAEALDGAALVVVEHSSRAAVPDGGMRVTRTLRHGDSALTILAPG